MDKTRPWALVTGASSGIGADLSLELARRGYSLLLTGRDEVRLAAMTRRLHDENAQAEHLALDLLHPDAIARLTAWVGKRPLEVLVNNAGFGERAPLAEATAASLAAMIHVNVTTLTLLTKALVPGMVERQRGFVLNVASTAAFSPLATMAVYGASKAFVLSFSEAVAEELKGTGVSVTAVCPGATVTRFADRAGVDKSLLFRMAMTSEAVARQAVTAALGRRRVKVHGWHNFALAFLVRLSPRIVNVKVGKWLMSGD